MFYKKYLDKLTYFIMNIQIVSLHTPDFRFQESTSENLM